MNKSTRAIALVELIGFVALVFFSKKVMDPYFWRFAGPVSLVMSLAILSGYMRLRGDSWRNRGLPRLSTTRDKLKLLWQVPLTFVAFGIAVATVILGGEALGLEFMTVEPEGIEARWGSVRGSLPQYLLWLGIVWTAAAFGEEMFFRGYLITQMEKVFGDMRFGTILAIFLAAAFFGYGHYYYQGLRGLILTGAIGFAFGLMFVFHKRSLWPIIILHGLIDTLTFTALYKGWE